MRDGGILACPTEGVWGLACIASNDDAVQRTIDLKERSATKGLIIIGADYAQVSPLLATPEPAWKSRMDSSWPGPMTFVAPAARDVSPLLTGGRLTLAVRVSDHPVLAALTRQLGEPIVSTSANLSGERPLKTAAAIRRVFGDRIDGIVAGELGGRRKPTDIMDVRTGRRLR